MRKADYISDGIDTDILSNMPAKSLLRFKTACKTWYSLISDPKFINLHSKRASRNPKILLSTPGRDNLLQIFDYERRSFDDSCLSTPIKFSGKTFNPDHAKIVGSCRGLICVGLRNRFSIWNPLTREDRKLSILSGVEVIKYEYYFHGLGYDSVANDFKLFISILEDERELVCGIFSLKANSWKIIVCPIAMENDHHSTFYSLATVLNGMFYWISVSGENHYVIVAFDLSRETFEQLQLPKNVPWKLCVPSLLEHEGCLCVSFTMKESCNSKEIWMMKEYGRWVHWLTITTWPPIIEFFKFPVLCISTRDEVVFRKGRRLMRCGSEDGKLHETGVEGYVFGTILYVETLISPNVERGWSATYGLRP